MSTVENTGETVVFNMKAIETAKFEVLPEGEYDGVIRSCAFAKSKSSGQPMWNLQIVVNGGEYDGRMLFAHLSFSSGAAPITKKHLMNISPELADNDGLDLVADAAELVNLPVRVKVIQEQYKGEPQNRIKNFLAVS